jgi:hypothetical protein
MAHEQQHGRATLPNDLTPGTSSANYNVWRAHFAQTAGSGVGVNANGAIPPASLVLLLMEMLSSALVGARQRHKLVRS